MYQTGNPSIDTLLNDIEAHWNGNGSFEEAASVTFSFVTTKTNYNATFGIDGENELVNFQAFTAPQAQAVRDMLKAWSNVANLTFTEVTDNINVHGNIRFMNTTDIGGAAGLAFLPSVPSNGNKEFFAFAGDVYINQTGFSAFDFSEHGFGRSVLIHEIGHALGLNHPNDSDSLGTVPVAQNSDRFSVMTTPANGGVREFESDGVFPTGPMLFDILAIQHLYGANMSFRTGNDTYAFNDSSLVYETIWDAGGIDTISVANSNFRAIIDLRAGKFSSIVESPDGSNTAATNNLAIAFGATIENANGGNAGDTITGNGVRNILKGFGGRDPLTGNAGNDSLFGGDGIDRLGGGAGNDKLDGGAGGDTMTGGAGNDAYLFDSVGDKVVELAGGGTDLVTSSVSFVLGANVERGSLTGAADINATGNVGDNELIGNAGRNVLSGASGGDVLRGLLGNDVLSGGLGGDVLAGGGGKDGMTGGGGADHFLYRALTDGLAIAGNTVRGAQSADTIADFGDGADDFRFLASAFNPLGDIVLGDLGLGDSFSVIAVAYNGTNPGTNTNHAANQATFVFSTADATLYYDANGTGAGYTVIATLANAATLTAADIAIVAT